MAKLDPIGDALTATIVTEPVRLDAASEEHAARTWLSEVASLSYATPSDEADASTIMLAIREEGERLDEKRKTITGPLNTAKRAVDALFMPAINACKEAEETIKKALAAAANRRSIANELARQHAMLAAQAGDTEAVAQSLSMVRDESPPPGVIFRERWEWSVTNETQIPRHFLTVNGPALDAYAKALETSGQTPNVPGVSFRRGNVVAIAPRRAT